MLIICLDLYFFSIPFWLLINVCICCCFVLNTMDGRHFDLAQYGADDRLLPVNDLWLSTSACPLSTASDPDCHRWQRPCHAGHSHQLVLAVCSDSDLSHLENGFDVFRDTPLIWSIRFSVNNPVQQSLVAVLVLTQLDHGCTACSPSSMPERGVSTIQLQVKCDVNKHISQWLYCTSYAADLRFRLAVLVCCCLVDTALTSNPRQSM